MMKICQLFLVSLLFLCASSANAIFFISMSAKKFDRILLNSSPKLVRHFSTHSPAPSFKSVKQLGSEILPGVAMLKYEYAQKKIPFPATDLFSEAIYQTIVQKEPEWKSYLTKISIKADFDDRAKHNTHCAVGVFTEEKGQDGERVLLVVDTELGPWNPVVLPFGVWRHFQKDGYPVMTSFETDSEATESLAHQKIWARNVIANAILNRAMYSATYCWNDDVPNIE